MSPEVKSIDQCQSTIYYIETDKAMQRRVCDLSAGLAEAVQHKQHRDVQFIHQTVIDFLFRQGAQLFDRLQGGFTTSNLTGVAICSCLSLVSGI